VLRLSNIVSHFAEQHAHVLNERCFFYQEERHLGRFRFILDDISALSFAQEFGRSSNDPTISPTTENLKEEEESACDQ